MSRIVMSCQLDHVAEEGANLPEIVVSVKHLPGGGVLAGGQLPAQRDIVDIPVLCCTVLYCSVL